MWRLEFRVSRNKLPEIVNIIRKRFFLPMIHAIVKESNDEYIIRFGTTSTLEEILRILEEADLYYYLERIERGA